MAIVADSLIERFQTEGFVVVPDLLDDDELERFQLATRAAVAKRKEHDKRSLEEKSVYERSFLQCQNLWEDFPDVRPLTFHPRLGEVAAALIGASAVRLFHDQALFKEPGGRETDPHQDLPYWPIEEDDALTAWIPFAGSTLESGCMGYVPGSHRLGIRKFVNIFFADRTSIDEQAKDLMIVEPRYVEVPKGGVAFHHGLTAHLARPNRTDHTREVHTVIYFRDGCTRSAGIPHPAVERAGIEVGAAIASDVTPVIWPRPEGDLPTPPPPPGSSSGRLGQLGIHPGGADKSAG
jgi:ectoine hydroxylase-related dioxygenase (phytanoyl-CoA dioxygenase family)